MAKDFDLNSNDEGKSGQRDRRRDPIPFDARRRNTNNARPTDSDTRLTDSDTRLTDSDTRLTDSDTRLADSDTRLADSDTRLTDSDKGESEASWPGSWPGSWAGAGALFLLGVAISSGLYPIGNDKKSTATISKPDEQLQSGPTSRPSSPVRPLSKPSAITPTDTTRPKGSIVPRQVANAVSNLPGVSALHYPPMRYEATHKKVFGSCTGQLELTNARLHFRCPNQADLNFPVDAIAKAHKDGVVLKSGKKYHFLIANHTNDQVEAIFILWLNRVQRFQQPSPE